jgi:cytoskeletal protein RodZ
MKICPVCNDSFADQLNFCDVDGARLARAGSVHERNKWWSLLGAGLLVGAVVISAASILFFPKARVPSPTVASEPSPNPAPVKAPAVESDSNVAASSASTEPESSSTDAVMPEVKKKDRPLATPNAGGAPPNPKAAALAAEEADKKAISDEADGAIPPVSKKPETPPALKGAGDPRLGDSATKPQSPSDLKKDQKTQTTTAKGADKDSRDKKKDEDKEKKKGGFLRVFKKIFGKG